MKKVISTTLFLASAAGLWAQSQSINFGSDIAVGLNSDNSAWTANVFTFQLGSFDVGFIPSSSNVNDWLTNWNVANQGGQTGTAAWLDDGGDLYFAGSGAITSLTAPFAASTQLYIWGFDSTANGENEWILLTSANWKVAENITDAPVQSTFLTTGSGVTTILGTHSTAAGESFKSAAVTIGAAIPEPATYTSVLGLLVLGYAATRRRAS